MFLLGAAKKVILPHPKTLCHCTHENFHKQALLTPCIQTSSF